MIRITALNKIASGVYDVSVEATGNEYRYQLTGGALTREKSVREAATVLAGVSDGAFRTAAMIRLMLEGGDADGEHADMAAAWRQQALCLDVLALAVPSEISGLRTGSRGGNDKLIRSIHGDCEKIRAFIIKHAPGTWQGGEAAFKERWASYVLSKDFSTSVLTMINKEFNRAGNQPALAARSASAPAEMRAWALNQATKHIPDLVPLKEEGPRIIRGDRAASLLNIIVPRIEAQIEQISDPEEKAALRARLERLGDKVEIAAANRSRERLRQDVMLSIETLEEQIDARLPSDTPSGP